jgi:succinate-semialdehyde dehydrogenase/glutarate-semialdehyde dehydrogenase
MSQSANTLKRLSLELGGNAPLVVFGDADVDAAVIGAMAAKFRNAGQTCVCANRILLHSSIADEFLIQFVRAAEKMNVADGFDPTSNMGPMINKKAKHKAQALVDDALSKGAVIRTSQKQDRTNNFMAPIVLSGVTTDMDIAHTEIFGPVAPIFIFETDAEAISLANDTPYGLAAYFWTRDLARAWHVAEQLQVGMVGINENAISSPGSPFGGVKESGLGREGSRYGLDDYLDIKSFAIGGL